MQNQTNKPNKQPERKQSSEVPNKERKQSADQTSDERNKSGDCGC